MPNSSGFARAYKILSWSSIVALIFVIILVLHKSPPPNVPYDKTASTRVEQKIAAADQAKAAGQPSQVQLNSTEVNSVIQDSIAAAQTGQNQVFIEWGLHYASVRRAQDGVGPLDVVGDAEARLSFPVDSEPIVEVASQP